MYDGIVTQSSFKVHPPPSSLFVFNFTSGRFSVGRMLLAFSLTVSFGSLSRRDLPSFSTSISSKSYPLLFSSPVLFFFPVFLEHLSGICPLPALVFRSCFFSAFRTTRKIREPKTLSFPFLSSACPPPNHPFLFVRAFSPLLPFLPSFPLIREETRGYIAGVLTEVSSFSLYFPPSGSYLFPPFPTFSNLTQFNRECPVTVPTKVPVA